MTTENIDEMSMTLKEAIYHAREVAGNATCEECAEDHLQLAKWLEELEERRIKVNDMCKEQREIKQFVREQCRDYSERDYIVLMRWFSEWASSEAECMTFSLSKTLKPT